MSSDKSGGNKWTRNQKILLGGVIVAIFGLIINSYFLYQTSNQQIIINQEFNEFKAKLGDFDQLVTNNFSTNNIKFACPSGTEIETTSITKEEIRVICKDISIE